MKRIPKAIYQTAEEIEMRIAALETDALRLSPDTDAHRALMKDIARLRIYAEAKRLLAAPSTKPMQPHT